MSARSEDLKAKAHDLSQLRTILASPNPPSLKDWRYLTTQYGNKLLAIEDMLIDTANKIEAREGADA